MDLEGSRSKEGGDGAARNRQAPLPRTLGTWAGLLEPYSSQKEEMIPGFFFKQDVMHVTVMCGSG